MSNTTEPNKDEARTDVTDEELQELVTEFVGDPEEKVADEEGLVE